MKKILISFCLCSLGFSQSSTLPEEGTVYVPVGKRDPFQAASGGSSREAASLSPLERYAVEKYVLKAILRGPKQAHAMFEDPEGKIHILDEGASIGRERATVSRVLNREVILTERTVNYLGARGLYERVISLPEENFIVQGKPTPVPLDRGALPMESAPREPKSERQATAEPLTPKEEAPVAPPTPPQNLPPLGSTYNSLSKPSTPSAPLPELPTIKGNEGGGLVY